VETPGVAARLLVVVSERASPRPVKEVGGRRLNQHSAGSRGAPGRTRFSPFKVPGQAAHAPRGRA